MPSAASVLDSTEVEESSLCDLVGFKRPNRLYGSSPLPKSICVSEPVVSKDWQDELIAFQSHHFLPTEVTPSADPIAFWKTHSRDYPLLSEVALGILSIPATSADAERTFSTQKDIITPERSRLLPKNVDMLVFLARNLRQQRIELKAQTAAIKAEAVKQESAK
jgi:hypothetical protein